MYEIDSDSEQLFSLSFEQTGHLSPAMPDLSIVRSQEYAGVGSARAYSQEVIPIVAGDGRRYPEPVGIIGLYGEVEVPDLQLEEVEAAVTYPDDPEDDRSNSGEEVREDQDPDEQPVPGDAATPPEEPPKPPTRGGKMDGEGEWDDRDRIMAVFDSRLPRVDRETVHSVRASLRDDPALRREMVAFFQTEQPRLMEFVEAIVNNHATNIEEAVALTEEIAVLYCLIAAQNVADHMDEVYGFGVQD